MITIAERTLMGRVNRLMFRMPSGIARRRSHLLKDRHDRRVKAKHAKLLANLDAQVADRDRRIRVLRRDLNEVHERIDKVLPVYVRADELNQHHFGRIYAFTVSFNPDSVIRSIRDIAISREQVADISGYAHWLAQDAAHKIERTITDELGKQLGFPGGQ
jgi:hypothetical protein